MKGHKKVKKKQQRIKAGALSQIAGKFENFRNHFLISFTEHFLSLFLSLPRSPYKYFLVE